MVQSLYHLSDEQIRNLTLKEFNIKCENLVEVVKLYNPQMGGEEQKRNPEPTVESFGNLVKKV